MAGRQIAPRQRLRAAARVAGTAALVLGGLTLVWAFVIWQWGDPATALFTRYEQRQLSNQLEAVERRYRPIRRAVETGGTAGDSRITTAETATANRRLRSNAKRLRDETQTGRALGRLRVSRLGLDMVLVNGTDHDSLTKGPGADSRTYLPGEGKLVYIAGHRTTYGAPFARIDRLRRGDLIELEMPYGTFAYRVASHVIVPATDVGRLRSIGREQVALQACHPRFSAKERYIVYANPVSSLRSSAGAQSAAAKSTVQG